MGFLDKANKVAGEADKAAGTASAGDQQN